MSTTSLPSYYLAPTLPIIPAYSEEPQQYEQRLAFATRSHPRTSKAFVKHSKNGDAKLTLNSQAGRVPAYGSGGVIDGSVDIMKTEGVTNVEIKVEGHLQIKEIAEGGTADKRVPLARAVLWSKERMRDTPCPNSSSFRLFLPTTFDFENEPCSLPPTFSVKLSGLPGFTARIEYSISVAIHKAPIVKANFLGISVGTTTLTTPFVYYPRTRPAVPIPPPLFLSRNGFVGTPQWQLYESVISARRASLQDIKTRLYIPASRIFCAYKNIPFHLTLESSALSLASFLPFGPSGNSSTKKPTRLEIMRKVTVDVRNEFIMGTKTDMWRVDCIGDAVFKHAGDGPTWISFSGDITVDPSIKVMGFKAGGLTVKDCILFSMTPPEAQKAPFIELRQVVPLRLTTDVFSADGTGIGSNYRSESEYSVPSAVDDDAE